MVAVHGAWTERQRTRMLPSMFMEPWATTKKALHVGCRVGPRSLLHFYLIIFLILQVVKDATVYGT